MGRPHEKLKAWQLSVELVTRIYEITRPWPDEEKFGLTSQSRRAAVSIPANIAEGAAKDSQADFCRFLYIARGSLSELETLLLIAKNLGFIEKPVYDGLLGSCGEIGRLIDGLLRKVKVAGLAEQEVNYEAL
jgi:four helix bundle protein